MNEELYPPRCRTCGAELSVGRERMHTVYYDIDKQGILHANWEEVNDDEGFYIYCTFDPGHKHGWYVDDGDEELLHLVEDIYFRPPTGPFAAGDTVLLLNTRGFLIRSFPAAGTPGVVRFYGGDTQVMVFFPYPWTDAQGREAHWDPQDPERHGIELALSVHDIVKA